jgi:tetraacyldisaccharide 4'-kinase
LLDDAFQHRKIRPNLSILLADYNRPLYRDSMLPGGNMREWSCFAKRADIMVITKSPADMTVAERKDIERRYARIFPHELFFTIIKYGEPQSVFPAGNSLSTDDIKYYDVLLVTGIANPKPFEAYIRQYAASVQTVNFPDHHAFSEKDINRITEKWNNILSANKILFTTEKDAVRLQQMKVPETIAKNSYYTPVEIDFTDDGKNCTPFRLPFLKA